MLTSLANCGILIMDLLQRLFIISVEQSITIPERNPLDEIAELDVFDDENWLFICDFIADEPSIVIDMDALKARRAALIADDNTIMALYNKGLSFIGYLTNGFIKNVEEENLSAIVFAGELKFKNSDWKEIAYQVRGYTRLIDINDMSIKIDEDNANDIRRICYERVSEYLMEISSDYPDIGDTLSILLPAINENARIELTILHALSCIESCAIRNRISDYEYMIIMTKFFDAVVFNYLSNEALESIEIEYSYSEETEYEL